MRRIAWLAVLTAVLVVPQREAEAILIRHDVDDAEYRELGRDFPAVGQVLPDGEGTLIAPEWVLTAAHVAQGIERRAGGVRFGDRRFDAVAVYLHPDWRPGGEHDIALIRLDEPVPGIEPVALYRDRDETGRVVTFVGRGDFGDGRSGVRGHPGTLRGATNRVEETEPGRVIFTFDPPGGRSTPLEGISGPGDSGGPALVRQDGRLYVLGVSSAGASPEGRRGSYGSLEFYTRVSTHAAWIDSVLESPPARKVAAETHAIPDEVIEDRIRAFLAAYGAGTEQAMTAFFEEHMASSPDRGPLEQRVAGLLRLRGEWGRLAESEVRIGPGGGELLVQAANRPGEMLLLTFELQREPPHLIDAVMADIMGNEGDGGGQRSSSVPPPEVRISGPLSETKLVRIAGDYLRELERRHGFAGVLLLARDGRVFFEEAAGLASRRFGVPNTIDTRFNVGSITKDFTRVALGRLLEQGKLTLEDRIVDHLPDYPNRKVAEKVTVRHLVRHTSGLGDIFNERFLDAPKSRFREPEDFFPLFADEPLRFEPGTDESYSNAGYIVLGAILAAAAGMPYAELIDQAVFGPAGMTRSGFFALDDPVSDVAEGYTTQGCSDDAAGPCRSNTFMMIFAGCPAGGSYSTARDLLRFDQALRNHELLQPATLSLLFPGVQPRPTRQPATGTVGLAGGAPGVSAALESGRGMTIVVLANTDPPVTEGIARHLRRLMGNLSG